MSQQQSLQELVELGQKAMQNAEFDEALEVFSRVAIEDPTNPAAWFYLGVCYLETGQPDNAGEALDRAIAADPDYADAHYMRGTVMGATGHIDLAAECYRKALAIDPNHYKAEEFLIRTEALIESRKHYREAMRLIYSPQHEDDWCNRAVRELLDSVAIFPDSPAKNEFKNLSKYVFESGQRRFIYGPAVRGEAMLISMLGEAESALETNRWPDALTRYHEALDLAPDEAFIHHALGLCYFYLEDLPTGIRAWRHVIDIAPEYDFSAVPRLSQ